jgi:hypothetical protein
VPVLDMIQTRSSLENSDTSAVGGEPDIGRKASRLQVSRTYVTSFSEAISANPNGKTDTIEGETPWAANHDRQGDVGRDSVPQGISRSRG